MLFIVIASKELDINLFSSIRFFDILVSRRAKGMYNFFFLAVLTKMTVNYYAQHRTCYSIKKIRLGFFYLQAGMDFRLGYLFLKLHLSLKFLFGFFFF